MPDPALASPRLAPWGHRPALDGIRTISVYLVVAFHAGITLFAGGFIGVDMFFVLSGYLVTTVLWNDLLHHGRIRFGHFYSRRARRLIPAALVAIVTIAVFMVLVATRISRLGYVNDGQAAALWFANWNFIREASDYFAAANDKSPYLHYWSLSIEEQFYVLFPLLLWGLTALAHKLRRPMIVPAGLGVIAAMSLVAQLALSDVTRSYYGTDTRAYQLLVGAIAALIFDRARSLNWSIPAPLYRAAGPVALIGLGAFLVVSLDRFDVGVGGRGVAAAAVSLTVIAALELNPTSPTAALLSVAPMTYLGRISYGTYLWHWPIIVGWELLYPDTSPLTMFAISTLGATGLAAVSHAVVEMPLRRARPAAPYLPIIAAGIAAGIAVALVLPTILRSDSRPVLRQWVNDARTVQTDTDTTASDSATLVPTVEPSEFVPHDDDAGGSSPTADTGDATTGDPAEAETGTTAEPNPETVEPAPQTQDTGPVAIPDAATLEAIFNDRVPDPTGCKPGSPQTCVLRPEGSPKVLLLGDSSGRLLVPALTDLSAQHGFSFAVNTAPGCPWQNGLHTADKNWERSCQRAQRATYESVLETYEPDIVITFALGRHDPEIVEIGGFVGFAEPYASLGPDEALDAATRDSIDVLLEYASKVVLIEPVPLPPQEPMECLSIYTDARDCTYTHHTEVVPTEQVYRAIAAENPAVVTVSIDAISCPHYPTCELIDTNGDVVYRDGLHVWQGYYEQHEDQLWAALSGAIATG